MLNVTQAVTRSVRHTFDYKGRARRSEFWWTTLFFMVSIAAIAYLDIWFLPDMSEPDAEAYFKGGFKQWLLDWKYWFFSTTAYYLTLPILLAVTARRMHDVGRRAWIGVLPFVLVEVLYFFPFGNLDILIMTGDLQFGPLFYIYVTLAVVMLVFSLYTLVLSIFDSQKKTNRYGPSPKYPD